MKHNLEKLCGNITEIKFENGDNWWYTNSSRFRGIFSNINEKVEKITLLFLVQNKCSGELDVDYAIRKGIMIWFGYQDYCNHYQAYWRHDSKLDGVYVGVQKKVNHDVVTNCAGKGYYPVGENWRKMAPEIDNFILHKFSVYFPVFNRFVVSCDDKEMIDTIDTEMTFVPGKIGIRTDNVNTIFKVFINQIDTNEIDYVNMISMIMEKLKK